MPPTMPLIEKVITQPGAGRAGHEVDGGRIPYGRIYGDRPDSRRVRPMYGPRGRRGLEEHRSGKTSEEGFPSERRC